MDVLENRVVGLHLIFLHQRIQLFHRIADLVLNLIVHSNDLSGRSRRMDSLSILCTAGVQDD
jgi:hypothetical protein